MIGLVLGPLAGSGRASGSGARRVARERFEWRMTTTGNVSTARGTLRLLLPNGLGQLSNRCRSWRSQ
jgi:hypothetical protein